MALFTGSGVAIVTPFKNRGVDFEKLGNLIDWQISEGTDAIIICGTTGEASTLTDEEQIETVAFTVKRVAGRVPVIAGGGSNDTHHGINLNIGLEKTGADGLLHVTPYYNKCTQKGLIQHYTAIADQVHIPMIIYSVASRTGVNIAPDTVAQLSRHPNIIGIKEASGNIAQVAEIARLVPSDFSIYSGNDDMIVPLLSLGGRGVISTVANIAPRDTHNMVARFFAGDIKGACELQLRMKPLIDSLFVEVNPIPVKAALHLMGKIDLEYRLPLCPPEQSSIDLLTRELKAYGLI